MAYKFRYFEAFVGTTQTIGEDSITEDKIDAGAVGSEEIENKGVATEDLADGSVTSVKLAADAVVAAKIPAGSISPDKLTFTPVTRPLVPPVATAEIADGAVTSDKMAAAIIDTPQLVDLAVTAAKIDTDTITANQIAQNTITGLEIASGAVGTTELGTDSVVTAKIADDQVSSAKIQASAITTVKINPGAVDAIRLATDAVETLKIKDLNVTAPKLADAILADRILESLYDRRQVFYDDFVGAVLLNYWAGSGDGGFTTDLANSNVAIKTAAGINSVVILNWNGKVIYLISRQKPILMVMDLSSIIVGNSRWKLGLQFDDNNYVAFERDTAVDNNIRAVCNAAGTPTSVDTGIAPVDQTQIVLKIEVVSETEVKFTIDGTLKATIVTNIPTSVLEAHFEVENLIGATRRVDLDKVLIIATPFFVAPP